MSSLDDNPAPSGRRGSSISFRYDFDAARRIKAGAFDEAIRTLWRSGHDSADIARRLGLDRHSIVRESDVANRLAVIRDAIHAAQQERGAASLITRSIRRLIAMRSKPASKRATSGETSCVIQNVPGLRLQIGARRCDESSIGTGYLIP